MMRSIFLFFAVVWFHPTLYSQVDVITVSAMKPVMMGEDLSAHVQLDSLKSIPNLYAVCPLNRLEGEVTILNGQIYRSTVQHNQVYTDQQFVGTAPFMVYAQVKSWNAFVLTVHLHREEDVQTLIESMAVKEGYNTSQAFPFLIQAQFDTIAYHVISKPKGEKKHNHTLHNKAKKHFQETATEGTLLGFYSKHHEGVFTHKGSFTHVHYVSKDESVTGHVEKAVVRTKEITLFLPKKNE